MKQQSHTLPRPRNNEWAGVCDVGAGDFPRYCSSFWIFVVGVLARENARVCDFQVFR